MPLVARCLETIDVCIWCMFVFMSVVVNVCCVVPLLKIVFFLSCRGCDGCRVFCLYCEA